MTLLSIANNVLPEIGLPTLTTVVGNGHQTARLLLALANREGRSLAKNNWRILVKRNVVTTVSSAESYSLPTDFDRFIHNTEWNATSEEKLWGPYSDEYWQADLSGMTVVTVGDRYQVRADGVNNRIFIRPIPTSAEDISFFYASNGWCRSKGGTRQSSLQADTDVVLLDNFVFELGLKWRLLQAQKRQFEVELSEYMQEKKKAIARDGSLQTLRILGPVENPDFAGKLPESGYGT